jgi:hypothetical protein
MRALECEERGQHPTLWRFVTLYYIVSQTDPAVPPVVPSPIGSSASHRCCLANRERPDGDTLANGVGWIQGRWTLRI